MVKIEWPEAICHRMAARRKKSRLSTFKTGAVFLDLKLLQDVVLEFNKNFSAQ